MGRRHSRGRLVCLFLAVAGVVCCFEAGVMLKDWVSVWVAELLLTESETFLGFALQGRLRWSIIFCGSGTGLEFWARGDGES